ncbi:MAG TPA: hypothetical protein VIK55_13945 [Paludibacter sp.]
MTEAFYTKMESLSIPALEKMIKDLYRKFQKSKAFSNDKLEACLRHRKYLINKDFQFTPPAVKQIERVNAILIESTAKVLAKASAIYRQMQKTKAEGDDFLDDYTIQATVGVIYNGDKSILTLDEDENNGQSDYVTMADILDFTHFPFEHLRSFTFFDRDNVWSDETDEIHFTDGMLSDNWDIEVLSAPELSHIPYFCYASHILFCDSMYSLSDIIRINDIWNEVNVTWRNWGEKDRRLSDKKTL